MRIDAKAVGKAVGAAVPIVAGLMVGRLLSPYLPQFTAWVHTLGVWAPIAYVSTYIVAVICMMPAFLLIMVGGAVFGVIKGTALAFAGATVGGTSAFLIGRYFARDLVHRRVAANATLTTIDRAVGESGLRIVFLLRLSPAIPFVLSNYALGITRVKLAHFVMGMVGLLPVVATYAAYGKASGAGPLPDGSSPISPVVLGIGIVATVLLGVLLTRIVQKALRDAELARLQQQATQAS
jgi:uncharacterized membrane protein YdjX (TVP38/TMEM64 family)